MLTLFTNITEQLTDHEKNVLVPMLISTVAATHSSNQYTSKNIIDWFKASGQNVTGPRLRKMVNYIRVMNLCQPAVLIGGSNGYYLTTVLSTVDAQIESLQGRVDSMLAVIDSLKAQRENLKHNAA